MSAQVERILALSNEQLANLRGQLCPVDGCGEHDCWELCDRCGDRHGVLVDLLRLDLRETKTSRRVCTRCSRERECECCGEKLPRYLLINTGNEEDGGELFCGPCCKRDPWEAEGW